MVEDGERVAHSSIRLLGNQVESIWIGCVPFLLCHVSQVVDGTLDRHAGEVVDLAAAQDGGQNLVLLCGGKDEDYVGGWFLERLEEGIEG